MPGIHGDMYSAGLGFGGSESSKCVHDISQFPGKTLTTRKCNELQTYTRTYTPPWWETFRLG